jgi:hypothetical protein
MRNVLLLILLAAVFWQIYEKVQARRVVSIESLEAPNPLRTFERPPLPTAPTSPFKCDGRTYCSQMTSCAEATYFLKNCPGVKMDGNHDGVPCEAQWCNR